MFNPKRKILIAALSAMLIFPGTLVNAEDLKISNDILALLSQEQLMRIEDMLRAGGALDANAEIVGVETPANVEAWNPLKDLDNFRKDIEELVKSPEVCRAACDATAATAGAACSGSAAAVAACIAVVSAARDSCRRNCG